MTTVTIVDTTSWGAITVRGGDRVRFLQGLTTVNVQALSVERPSWGAILNPKGRVLSVIAVEPHGDDMVIRCQGNLLEKTHQILDRYAVMDDVTFEVAQPATHRIWQSPAEVWTAPFLSGAPPPAEGAGSSGSAAEIEIERIRIRGGFLEYGRDVDEDCFPFETPLGGFLDYGKGCYVGQEPVFRVHAQGNTARMLRGFVIEGAEPIEPGAIISHPIKEKAGTITSAVRDGALGTRWLALGYLHRSVWGDGAEGVTPQVKISGRSADVHALPF
jgi:tRNA-modifying protein YgfZ